MTNQQPFRGAVKDSRANVGESAPSLTGVYRAANTISDRLHRTPLVRSEHLSAELDADVYLKREDTLPTGAFKVRGGLNFASQQPPGTELVTASTGNHGQSIAYAGRAYDLPVTVVVPADANRGKIAAIERYDARVITHGADMDTACAHAQSLAAADDACFVHPANEPLLVEGVATAGLEVVDDLPDVDYVFTPIGGGSGATGYCLTTGALVGADVVGVQTVGADAVYRAITSGSRQSLDSIDTFADGLAVGTAFELTISVLREELADCVRVTDADLEVAIHMLLDGDGVLAEGAAAAGLAGAIACRERIRESTVVVPITGGNLATATLRRILDAAAT